VTHRRSGEAPPGRAWDPDEPTELAARGLLPVVSRLCELTLVVQQRQFGAVHTTLAARRGGGGAAAPRDERHAQVQRGAVEESDAAHGATLVLLIDGGFVTTLGRQSGIHDVPQREEWWVADGTIGPSPGARASRASPPSWTAAQKRSYPFRTVVTPPKPAGFIGVLDMAQAPFGDRRAGPR
jgi:hypothetical protein